MDTTSTFDRIDEEAQAIKADVDDLDLSSHDAKPQLRRISADLSTLKQRAQTLTFERNRERAARTMSILQAVGLTVVAAVELVG